MKISGGHILPPQQRHMCQGSRLVTTPSLSNSSTAPQAMLCSPTAFVLYAQTPAWIYGEGRTPLILLVQSQLLP